MSELREIVLDTETTGLEPPEHRIVEIGALELINHVPTGRVYHQYINPGRPMPAEAFAVHGISDSDLADKPAFAAIAEGFAAFVGDATLVIHNAAFDIRFLDFELERAGHPVLGIARAVDTLAMARERFPGAQNTLDALCRRFGVDSTRRIKHGALLDSELLAEVYAELMGGRQSALSLVARGSGEDGADGSLSAPAAQRPGSAPTRLTDAEREAHDAFVGTLGADALWLKG